MEKIIVVLNRLTNQRHMSAINKSISAVTIPSLIGSFFFIVRFIPLHSYSQFMDRSFLGEWLLYPVTATMGIMGIIVLLSLSYHLAESYKIEPLGVQITAIMCFFISLPNVNNIQNSERFLDIISYFGVQGIFPAILIGLFSTEIYRRIAQLKIAITLPHDIPPAILNPFISMLPGYITLFCFLLFRITLEYVGINDLFLSIAQNVTVYLTDHLNSLGGILLYTFLYHLFWAFGIHGDIINPLYMPIWVMLREANRIVFQIGDIPPTVMTYEFHYSMIGIGGTGATLAIVLLALFFAKSSHLRFTGKMALMPALFQINEPILFGIPMVLNPIMGIPFVLTGLTLACSTFLSVQWGIISYPSGVVVPWVTPTFVNVFLLTNGDWRAVVLQLVHIIIAMAIYFPFFYLLDQRLVQEE